MIQIVHSHSHDPYHNLALEDYLMHWMSGRLEPVEAAAIAQTCGPDSPSAILYLWQNNNTVVIGRNQNAWAECKTALLEEEGGKLARRTTGGGAVFHDLGNLNFSLLVPQTAFDLDRNFQMIVDTVRKTGVPAERSGRNDILADGQKFSGNAFRIDHSVGLHHGTLLVSSAFERVGRYLTVAPAKLTSKGITSVRSRVTNLSTFRPDLTVTDWMGELETIFLSTFGAGQAVTLLTDRDIADHNQLHQLQARFESWDWRYGETMAFDAELTEHLPWGHLHLGLKVEQGRVRDARLFSDALDCDWIAALEGQLLGQPFSSATLAEAIRGQEKMPGGFGISRAQMAQDLADLVTVQGW